MNDITALMATMKTAAIRAKAATEDYLAHRMTHSTYMSEIEEFVGLVDGPENVLALVEALEKSQNWERQWKEAAERRGKRLTRQALEILREGQRITELENSLKQMIQAHKNTLRTGYERIVDLGGDCDSPDVMIAGNPDIQQAEKLLAAGIQVIEGEA